MPIKAHFDEARQTQLPAVELLLSLGYSYISVDEALRERRGDVRNVILRDIAFSKLKELNKYEIDGEQFDFSDGEINGVIDELESLPFEGLTKTAQNIYHMTMPTSGGKSIEVRKGISKDFRFFDFANPDNNSFHVTVEFTIQGKQERRPDVVCFVNGIPFAVIEYKKGSVEIDDAINQMVRNQSVEEAPKLFTFTHLLAGSNGSDFRYGTTGTKRKFYAVWKEKEDKTFNAIVQTALLRKVEIGVYETLLKDLKRGNTNHVQILKRSITEQDRSIVAMFSKNRLLDLAKHFVLFDGCDKKIARYQQYFAIQKMRDRIKEIEVGENGEERRRGGIVWHTQGSGKSLTMVLFVKALIEDPSIINPRVIIVTDRRDLDRQIKGTFLNCGLKKDVTQARSGEHLLSLIKEKSLDVVTTLVQKFESATKNEKLIDSDSNIFVLIDEAHRSHGGMASLEMKRVIPNACPIAFTGTPLMKKERESWRRFGDFIDKYTIDDAVLDGNVLPLIYEPRYVPLTQNAEKIDVELDRVKERAKNQYSAQGGTFDEKEANEIGKEALISNPQRLREIVVNVEKHFIDNLKGTGLKAQLVAPSKFAAVTMQKMFEEHGLLESAVVISDEPGIVDKDDYRKKEVLDYLEKIKQEKSGIELYEKNVIESFVDNPDGIELLIVVSKLLTGFDAPRNTVLYLAKSLKDHDLLQAIARVNRLCENTGKAKTSGFIIDYSENAENLSQAMKLFGNYDEEDIKGTLVDTSAKIYELEQGYSALHDIFRSVNNSNDAEEYLKLLGEGDEARKDFSKKLNNFTKLFSECLSINNFNENFTHIDLYKTEFKKYLELRKTANLRYGEMSSLLEFKFSIQKILDQYVDAEEVEILADAIDIRNFSAVKKAVGAINGDEEKAEAIATQTQKVISERLHEDPAYFRKLSEKVDEIIRSLREGKLQDLLALQQIEELYKESLEKSVNDVPSQIAEEIGADIFYRNILPFIEDLPINEASKIDFVLGLFTLLKSETVVDFHVNLDVQRRIANALDDYLYDGIPSSLNIKFHDDTRREMIEMIIQLAKNNYKLFE